MSDTSIVIIGAKGQLGLALLAQYPQAVSVDADELDITDVHAVNNFDWTGIDVIINAAAYTNVDGAETPDGRKAAWAVNAAAPANLTAVATQYGCTLVHVSTDYVFDGTNDNHTEEESFTPLSVYGASKAAGDIAVSLAPQHYILRTSWVIGDGNNFVRTMMNLTNKDISPSVVSDQIGRLTFTSELVRAIDHLLQTNPTYGTYNVTNSGDSASWADITRTIHAFMGRDDLSVTDVSTEDYFRDKELYAPRPLLSALDLKKLSNSGFKGVDWKIDLKKYISEAQ